jgi:UDP-sulfoquinovose synthase
VDNACLLDLGLDPTTLRDNLLSEIIDVAQLYAHRCDESRILSTSPWVRPRPSHAEAIAS